MGGGWQKVQLRVFHLQTRNLKIPNFTVSCLPGLYQFERPHLTGSCDFWAQLLGLGDHDLDYDEVEADNSVEAEKLDSDEAFEVEPQVVEVAEIKGVLTTEVGDIDGLQHFEAGVGALSEVETLSEVGMLMSAVERLQHL